MTGMTDLTRRRRFARLLQRRPGVIRALYPFYQLTRPRFSMGVVGVVFDAQHRILMAEHVYHPLLPWSVPGGGVNSNEDPSVAVMREFQEELAMPVQVLQLLIVEKTHFRHVDVAFLCQSNAQPIVSSAELLDAQWFARDALPPMTQFQYRAVMRAYALLDREPRLGNDLL
jgi:ADP-ribose pyrophosphatase YjhB (NUDIX family)